MNILLKSLIIIALGASVCTQAMSYEHIKERNAKLLAEDEKKFAHEASALEAQVPAVQDQAIRRKSCSLNLRELALPLSCFLFLAICGAGGTYCKQTKQCLYDSNSDAPTNSTTNSTLQFQPYIHTLKAHRTATPMIYTRTQNMLHVIRNKRGRARKR